MPLALTKRYKKGKIVYRYRMKRATKEGSMKHEVWYTTKQGVWTQAWQGLSYAQAWDKVKELGKMGYNAAVLTPGT
jgi:hypothetical protein